MRYTPEPTRFRPRRRPALELGMTPLIDIVFLLLIFFMLTSHFVVQEGIQVDLPVTERSHSLPSAKTHRITVRSEGVIVLDSRVMSIGEVRSYLRTRGDVYMASNFEILADRDASVQTVISLLEVLRDQGAVRVTIGTERSGDKRP